MNSRLIPRIALYWMTLALVLAPLPQIGMAGGPASLDQQFIEAAERSDLELVRSLLAKGADVNARRSSFHTALMEAVSAGNVKLAGLLLDKGADVNARGPDGVTALIESVSGPTAEGTRLLLARGADVNAKTNYGTTALIFAAMTGFADVVQLLLEHGADVNAESASGLTAIRQAEIRNYREIVKLLKQAGAVSRTGKHPLIAPHSAKEDDPAERDSDTYPDSPEGVVKAFINEALEDGPVTVEEMGLCYEILLVQNRYFINERDLLSDTSDDLQPSTRYNLSTYNITDGFEISEVKQDGNRATVKVAYRRLGWISVEPIHITECRSKRPPDGKQEMKPSGLLEAMIKTADEQKVWGKERCRFLHITNDTPEVTYNLARPGKTWRIIDSYDPYISVSSAIKLLQCTMRHRPNVSTTYPSKAQVIEITQDIGMLEQHLSR